MADASRSRPHRPPRLPQRYPFLFVDRVIRDSRNGDRALLGVSAGSRSVCGFEPPALASTLLLEAMAQACLALLTADAAPTGDAAAGAPKAGALVGIDEAGFEVSLAHAPPRPGDRLVVGCEVVGRFGRMSKVAAWLERDGQRVATATLLLASG